jgi:hypothetical protein
MTFWSDQPRWLRRTTIAYAIVWLLALLAWRIENTLPQWLLTTVFLASVPLVGTWLFKVRENSNRFAWAVAGTVIYPLVWHLAVYLANLAGLSEIRAGLTSAGAFGLFFVGLLWVVWFVERASRRIELARIEETQSSLHARRGEPAHIAERRGYAASRRNWSPLDPSAWYYGRSGQKLKQSTLAFTVYALAFWLALGIVSQIGGCYREYEMPAGGGQQKTVAQTVRIQKVIRKKFVINPLSAIKFNVPPIDEVKLQLQEITAHQYTIGYGEGTGAGFAGGTSKGKVRLIRLQYDGGDWDLNYGIGGDVNMLLEYSALTQQKTADKTEAIRISQLASFPPEKSPPLVFLTGQKSISTAKNEEKILREYLIDKHGLLFASSGSQHFHNQFIALMNRVLPDVRPVPVPLDDTVHRVPFAVPTLPYVVPHGGKDALGWSMDGRWLAYYHPGDISDAWADGHSGVSPDIYNACYQLGANVINYGHVEYSKWLQAKQGK